MNIRNKFAEFFNDKTRVIRMIAAIFYLAWIYKIFELDFIDHHGKYYSPYDVILAPIMQIGIIIGDKDIVLPLVSCVFILSPVLVLFFESFFSSIFIFISMIISFLVAVHEVKTASQHPGRIPGPAISGLVVFLIGGSSAILLIFLVSRRLNSKKL